MGEVFYISIIVTLAIVWMIDILGRWVRIKNKTTMETKNKIKQMIADGVLTQEVAERYFPELKESEDDNIRRWIINEIKIKHHNLDEDNVDFVDKAIAWLEKQGEQKSIEWSEEDKGILLSVKCVIDEVWHSDSTFGYDKAELEEMWNWLDDIWQKVKYPQTQIQNTWKPSKEQIAAIQESVGIVGELTPRGECLKELIEQLKKLRDK